MTKKNKHKTKVRAPVARRPVWWIVGLILLAVLVAAGYWFWEQNATLSGPDPSKLIGRWLRPDGGYVLELSYPAPDGVLKAAYFNPRPINVSRAEWKRQDGFLRMFIELRDVNYPGSTYTLDYQPTTDKLTGIYFQAALGQQFEVEFERTQ
jgi:hypothetical protein